MELKPDIKQALNSIYGKKPITDRCLEAAISEKLDLTKPEDVVLALFHAYSYMYNRSDNDDAEAIMSKYSELCASYDSITGKPKTETRKILSNLDLTYEIQSLQDDINRLKPRLYKIERWKALESDSTDDFKKELNTTRLSVENLVKNVNEALAQLQKVKKELELSDAPLPIKPPSTRFEALGERVRSLEDRIQHLEKGYTVTITEDDK